MSLHVILLVMMTTGPSLCLPDINVDVSVPLSQDKIDQSVSLPEIVIHASMTGVQARHPCVYVVNSSKLNIANCSYRALTEVPRNLRRNINVLLLDHNHISSLLSHSFKYENLTYLDISNNKLQHIMNDSFRGLTRLKRLHMERNNYEKCPEKSLSVLHSLEELHMDGEINMTFGEHFQNLTKLYNLSLSGNIGRCNIRYLCNRTFEFVPHLKVLDVSNCSLMKLEPGTFLPLRRIEQIDISDNNKLQFDSFQNATYGLMNTSIRVLKANAIVNRWSVCNVLSNAHTQYLKHTRLERLYFDSNRLESLQANALLNLPDSLWFISARYNRLTYGPYLKDLKHMTSVKELYLGHDKSSSLLMMVDTGDMSRQCETDSDNSCLFCHKEDFHYDSELSPPPPFHSSYIYPISIDIPPNLTLLNITCDQLHFNIPWITFSNNSIRTLILSCNLLQNWTGPVENLKNVEYLDLSNNLARYVSTAFLSSFPKLKVLNISLNYLGWMMFKRNKTTMLDNLTLLEELDMSNNDIHILPENIFNHLESVKTLNLSYNPLYLDLPLRVVSMKKLQVLDISNTDVRWFSSILMKDLDTLSKTNDIKILMKGNSLFCSCNNLVFLNWIVASNITFVDLDSIKCALENKTFSKKGKFKDIVTMLRRDCSNMLGLILGGVFGVVLALVIITGGMAYRYRWNLRYWYYAAKLRLKDQSLLDPEDDSFQFDAFISHSNEDEHFVVNEMRNHLELEAGMTLNIHDRDFVPGRDIASNILSAIQESRKTVVVLSNNFLESYWCMYELQMANIESIKTGRDVLIIIMYEDISTKLIPKEILYHLKTESYIGYPHQGDEDHRDLFWRRFIAALKQ